MISMPGAGSFSHDSGEHSFLSVAGVGRAPCIMLTIWGCDMPDLADSLSWLLFGPISISPFSVDPSCIVVSCRCVLIITRTDNCQI